MTPQEQQGDVSSFSFVNFLHLSKFLLQSSTVLALSESVCLSVCGTPEWLRRLENVNRAF